jgi:hypothetical protein
MALAEVIKKQLAGSDDESDTSTTSNLSSPARINNRDKRMNTDPGEQGSSGRDMSPPQSQMFYPLNNGITPEKPQMVHPQQMNSNMNMQYTRSYQSLDMTPNMMRGPQPYINQFNTSPQYQNQNLHRNFHAPQRHHVQSYGESPNSGFIHGRNSSEDNHQFRNSYGYSERSTNHSRGGSRGSIERGYAQGDEIIEDSEEESPMKRPATKKKSTIKLTTVVRSNQRKKSVKFERSPKSNVKIVCWAMVYTALLKKSVKKIVLLKKKKTLIEVPKRIDNAIGV